MKILKRITIMVSVLIVIMTLELSPVFAHDYNGLGFKTLSEGTETASWQLNGIVYEIDLDSKTMTVKGSGDTSDFDFNRVYRAMNLGQPGWIPWYEYSDDMKKIVVEEGITEIGDYTFYRLRNVKSIKLPESLKTIGEGAFYACNSLKSVVLPSNVKSIGDKAFYNANNIENIRLNEGLERIGSQITGPSAIWLKGITIPETVREIGNMPFVSLNRIRFGGTVCPNVESRLGYSKEGMILVPENADVESFRRMLLGSETNETGYNDSLWSVETYHIGDTEDIKSKASGIRLKVTTSKTSKGIKVKVTETTALIPEIIESGYEVRYRFYRSDYSSKSGFELLKEKKSPSFKNTSGKKGRKYYYKCEVQILDGYDGTVIFTSKLGNCRAGVRKF